jgi:hypothetical protein
MDRFSARVERAVHRKIGLKVASQVGHGAPARALEDMIVETRS